MNLLEARYREVFAHLRGAYAALLPITELTDDAAATVLLKEEFRRLRHEVREFARCQHGVRAFHRRRAGGTGPARS